MSLEELYKLLLLLGSTLSLVLSIYLWAHPRKYFSNRVLGTLILCWAITSGIFALQLSEDFNITYPHVYGLGSLFAFLFFPLIYIYTKSYIYRDARKIRSYLIHFLPAVLYFIALAPFYFQSGPEKAVIIREGIPEWLSQVFNVGNLIIICQGVFYTIRSIGVVQHFEYFRNKRLSNYQLYFLRFLKSFIIINVILWGLGVTEILLTLLRMNLPLNLFKVYYLGVTILVMGMAYFTIRHPYFFSLESRISSLVNEDAGVRKSGKGGRSEGSSEELQQLVKFLENEKPYLNKDLSLQDLVNSTGISKHRISELFNQELRLSFYDIINDYRIKEAIRLFGEGKHKEFTLDHIAEESGFKSKATFYRVFKKLTAKTPISYIRSMEAGA